MEKPAGLAASPRVALPEYGFGKMQMQFIHSWFEGNVVLKITLARALIHDRVTRSCYDVPRHRCHRATREVAIWLPDSPKLIGKGSLRCPCQDADFITFRHDVRASGGHSRTQ